MPHHKRKLIAIHTIFTSRLDENFLSTSLFYLPFDNVSDDNKIAALIIELKKLPLKLIL